MDNSPSNIAHVAAHVSNLVLDLIGDVSYLRGNVHLLLQLDAGGRQRSQHSATAQQSAEIQNAKAAGRF